MAEVMGNPHLIWVPVVPAGTVHMGDIVTAQADEGVTVMPQGDGASDTTNKAIPYGIVVGSNRTADNKVFDTTYGMESMTDPGATAPHTATAERLFSSVHAKGDRRLYVRIARIYPDTLIKAPICNNTPTTAPSVVTVTTGSTTGLGFTSDSCDFTPVADLCTSYCRTGANRGIYRISDDTSKTTETNDVAFPYDIAVGDTFVRVPVKTHGRAYVRVGDDTYSGYINCSETPATDYNVIHVEELNLEKAGGEYCIFTFDMDQFCTARA